MRAAADALEDATWSAKRNTATGYGIGVSDLDPGRFPGDQTSIKYRYFQALNANPANPNTGATGAPNPDYTLYEEVTFFHSRRDH